MKIDLETAVSLMEELVNDVENLIEYHDNYQTAALDDAEKFIAKYKKNLETK